jgi:hypothetical protein
MNLLAIRCSDVRTITQASSCAKSFLIRRIRLLEFFRGCGAINRRQCGQNLCLQRYEVNAPKECSAFSYCFHVSFRTDTFVRTVTTCATGVFTRFDAYHSLEVTCPTSVPEGVKRLPYLLAYGNRTCKPLAMSVSRVA